MISPKEVLSSQNSLLIVDIRKKDDAILGSHDISENDNIDYVQIEFDPYKPEIFLQNIHSVVDLKNYTNIVISCYKGIMSQGVAKMLKDSDPSILCHSLEGGMSGWIESGCGVVK